MDSTGPASLTSCDVIIDALRVERVCLISPLARCSTMIWSATS